MSDTAIKAEGLGKRYRIGANQQSYKTLKGKLTQTAATPFRALRSLAGRNGHHPSNGHKSKAETIWALKDVSFEIKRGEVVGIIGRNGAGKSTLLKILSRITEPTEGYADITGRIASLLEVGTGFQPELTGRENVFLNGSILGMKRAEIIKRFDEIVAFAEVEKFVDTPVKHYSSGMYVRLAFGVAAHLDPEILLVDEVLAVGDAAFQKKCLGKMGDVAKQGRTVLFVSHNMAAIENLCGRAILLKQGAVAFSGDVDDCITAYMASGSSSNSADVDLTSHPAREANALPLLRRVRLLDRDHNPKDRFVSGEPMKIEFTFDQPTSMRNPQFGIGVNDWMGGRVFSLTTYFSDLSLTVLDNQRKVVCEIESLPLAPGRYTLCLSAGTLENLLIDNLEDAVSFDVESVDFYGNGRIPEAGYGRVLVRSHWTPVAD
ncbi:MAG: lipopolysaccharide transport system ATP-binding protein [Blastocatellia bacterium]|nr:lipopolysaccharide transport system ATP-binding protein [Blastocatellia bacterium]